jgi:hypothetical protein
MKTYKLKLQSLDFLCCLDGLFFSEICGIYKEKGLWLALGKRYPVRSFMRKVFTLVVI